VGLSDHTLGVAVPVAAVALGACIIEKHLTLRRSDGGLDAGFSLEPEEFRTMVDAVRITEKALGSINYDIGERERASKTFRRSLFVVKNMKAGDQVTKDNIRSIRPGHGLDPKYLSDILGRRLNTNVPGGTPLSWELLA
jgi:sialic acid synthase SpsE